MAFSSLRDRQFGKYGYLPEFAKGRALATVSVDPPSIAAGQTGYIDVTLTGAKVTPHQRAVFLPPADLEAGLEVTTTPIIDTDTVRVSFRNTSGDTIDGVARDWTAHLCSKPGV